ncbi:hypothetical protein GIB67_023753 [Kingdonia uniflora]|uniref:Uncharacterized protein n=1 Tax=Kingdonia uniflora TaxID=39325 RepID=A0A7J7LFY7_9MAGN|nr:hypothetical protein GIB67_023753 [Kingdonia uniflora]
MVQTRSKRIRSAAEGRLAIKIVDVWVKIVGSLGYDAELPIRKCQFEVLDLMGKELEYACFFFEEFFRELVRDSADREEVVGLIAEVIKAALDVIICEVKGVNVKIGTTGSGEAVKKEKKRRVEPSELSGGKVVEDRSDVEDDWKEVEEKARLAPLHEAKEMSKMSDLSKKGKRLEALKASQVVEINKLRMEARMDLDEVVSERNRLGRLLISKGYYEDEVEAIRTNTYVEEEVKDDTIGVVDRLDGMTPRSAKLESARLREDEARQCNQESVEEFDKMREANEDREDRHVKVHFKFVEATQAIVDLTRQIEEKDAKIEKGQKESREADMARYCIYALERSDEDLNRSELGRLKKKLADKDNKLMGAQDKISASEVTTEQLTTAISTKDMEFRMVQRKYKEFNDNVAQLKTDLVQANSCVRSIEVGECSKKNKNDARVSLIQGKEIVIKDKEELLKKIPDVEELNKEIEILRAQVLDLEVINRAESAKADENFTKNIAFTDRIDREIGSQKAWYKRLEDRLQRPRTVFSHSVVT